MNQNKQYTDFLHIGRRLLKWYKSHGRDLPFRKTKDPYKIWICEIVFQQTRIQQGLQHYINFIKRFPDVNTLALASSDDVLLHWKGLGYYSRAMNIHKAAKQIMEDFGGEFPSKYDEILTLKGVGKYTASAISSICFGQNIAAVDGNFYRVLSRLFKDDYDISSSKAFEYFSELSQLIMPQGKAGDFNQAMMDIGSEICKPKNPICSECPLSEFCMAYATGTITDFPVKKKKVEVKDLALTYYYINCKEKFLVKKRGTDFIWKNLYDFPEEIDDNLVEFLTNSVDVKHKLTHLNLLLTIHSINVENESEFLKLCQDGGFQMMTIEESMEKSFPKPLQNFMEKRFKTS